MSIRRSLPLVLIALLGAVLAGASPGFAPRTAAAASPRPDATPFTIDHVHSTLIYRLRHFGVSYFYGRINKPRGSFWIDDEDPSRSFLDVRVEIKEMDAGDDNRDRFLTGPDFFNAREFPEATFKSTDIRKSAGGVYLAEGTFTMRGVSKKITVQLDEFTAKQTDRFGYRGGFECTFTVKRSEYGMNLFVEEGTLGDETRITIAIEGVQRPK